MRELVDGERAERTARLRAQQLTIAVVTALLVGACATGGGGGGGTTSPPPTASPPGPPTPSPPTSPPPPPPPSGVPPAGSAETTVNYAIAATAVATAWANGGSGAGVVVAVIDDGVQASHPEIDSRILPASRDINSQRNVLFAPTDTHGSELSALIAGEFNGAQTIGHAYDAQILAVRADDGLGFFDSQDLIAAIDYAIANDVDIINFSLGVRNGVFFPPDLSDAVRRATAAGIIVVASAGNDALPEVNNPAFLASDPAISNNLILVAGAHDRSGALSSFSSRAGQTQNFYVLAPGEEIIVPDFGAAGPTDPAFQVCGAAAGLADGLCQVQGTSYSAPILTGAVAALRSAFPGLTPQQLVSLITQSTDDVGATGVDAIHGRGRLNLAKAFQPLGQLSTPLAGGGEAHPAALQGQAGPAFGDAFAGAGLSVASFDSLGRTFNVDLGRNWRRAPRPVPSAEAPLLWRSAQASDGAYLVSLSGYSADAALPQTLRGPADAADEPLYGYARIRLGDGAVTLAKGAPALAPLTRLDFSGAVQASGDSRAVAASYPLRPGLRLSATAQSWSPNPIAATDAEALASSLRLDGSAGPFAGGLTLGAMTESGQALGLAWDAGLEDVHGDTRYLGLAGGVSLPGGWRLEGEAEWGALESRGGLLQLRRPASTSAYALGLTSPVAAPLGANGRLTLSVRQPLRVERAQLEGDLPVSDAYGRANLRFERRVLTLAPSGRERMTELEYSFYAGERLSFSASARHTAEPGHIRAAEPETGVYVGLRVQD